MIQQDDIPSISRIGKQAVVMEADQQVRALANLFQDDPDLMVVPVKGEEGFLDCISRKSFQNLMSRPFTQDLYAKKPVSALLGALKGLGVAMAPGTDINTAALELLSVDPTLQTEAFPLLENGECMAVVKVSDLMLAVTEEQKRLLEELDRLSSRIREEVARGVKIQQDLLPDSLATFQGMTVAGGITTSSEIGGDFFDYFTIGDHQVGLVVADVSGHGVQAGMVTTAAKASLHTLLSLGVTTPGGLLSGMNNAILQTARQSLLMTCLIACIDTTNHQLTIANAGHNFPFVIRAENGEPEMMETAAGFPLGFDKDTRYQESVHHFAAGDALFLYTDGLVECTNYLGEEFGYQRMTSLLKQVTESERADQLHASMRRGASAFSGSPLFEDDVTTLYAVRKA
ncbi:hypothetical protein GMSM_26730 [Geomonas sp. Red276]